MTVVDVNTGKFTGSGGNLEETVTKNNLEAAEEIVRQLRLRDIGGIIVVDFIDMVLESNRDLVLRRLVECLGRDRTRHQVAEVTSLGLVQMTRKRIGTGLLEAFSETCEHCQGRGLVVHHEPVEQSKHQDEEPRRGRRGRNRGGDDNGGGSAGNGTGNGSAAPKASPSPKDIAAMARHENKPAEDEKPATTRRRRGTRRRGAGRVGRRGTADGPRDRPGRGAGADPRARAERPRAGADPRAGGEPPEPEPPPSRPGAEPVPVGPRIVTSSRRRVARRPAGPPAGGRGPRVHGQCRSGRLVRRRGHGRERRHRRRRPGHGPRAREEAPVAER